MGRPRALKTADETEVRDVIRRKRAGEQGLPSLKALAHQFRCSVQTLLRIAKRADRAPVE